MKRTPEREAEVAAALRDYAAGVRIADIERKYRMSLSELNNARRRAGLPSQTAMREAWRWQRAKANMALDAEK
jgi:hypothetical protein